MHMFSMLSLTTLLYLPAVNLAVYDLLHNKKLWDQYVWLLFLVACIDVYIFSVACFFLPTSFREIYLKIGEKKILVGGRIGMSIATACHEFGFQTLVNGNKERGISLMFLSQFLLLLFGTTALLSPSFVDLKDMKRLSKGKAHFHIAYLSAALATAFMQPTTINSISGCVWFLFFTFLHPIHSFPRRRNIQNDKMLLIIFSYVTSLHFALIWFLVQQQNSEREMSLSMESMEPQLESLVAGSLWPGFEKVSTPQQIDCSGRPETDCEKPSKLRVELLTWSTFFAHNLVIAFFIVDSYFVCQPNLGIAVDEELTEEQKKVMRDWMNEHSTLFDYEDFSKYS